MAGGKITPRAKMINLMYLVLLALLAMNVSKEILNSFALINNGLVKTNDNFSIKNENTYSAFEMALQNDENKVRPYYNKAQAVKKRSQEMFDYIESIKRELIIAVDKKDSAVIDGRDGEDSTIKIITNLLHLEAKDDANTPTIYFMGSASDDAPPGTKAYEFKAKIKKFKEDLLTHVDTKDRHNINLGLDINGVYSAAEGQVMSWESTNFYHNPAVAVLALLTKMQNDVKNAEADIINSLLKRIDMSSYKFDTLSARVVANSNYVLLGDEYRAEVFVAAFSSTSNPTVTLGEVDSITNTIKGAKDTSSVKVNKGIGIYSISPNAEGTVQWGGLIGLKDPSDPSKVNYYPFKSEYKAAKPTIVVSPDKMNLFYIGVDNPVSVSVPGIASEDLQPSVSGGSMSGSRGKYIVRVTNPGECTVNVSARTRNGVKSMGTGVKFRVKNVPAPVAVFMGLSGTGVMSQVQLKHATIVVAELKDFEFDLKFPVVGFNVSMTVNGQIVDAIGTSAILNENQKSLLGKAKKGMKVNIENVKWKRPDGKIIDIGGVGLKVI